MNVKARGALKPGVEVTIGGEKYTCPELDFGAIRRLKDLPQYPGPSGKTQADPHELMAYVLLESLRRNYDGTDAVWLNTTLLGSEIDGAALAELQVMRNSGLIAKADSAGEAPAVTG